MTYLLESAFCLAAFYGFYWLALRRETFFQWNRAYLLLAAALSFGLPLLDIQIFESSAATLAEPERLPEVVKRVQAVPIFFENHLKTPLETAWAWSILDLILAVYLLGAAFLALQLGRSLLRLRRFIGSCRREKTGDFVLAESPEPDVPGASFFSFIFWKKGELSENEQFILQHEVVHVRQWHSLDVLLMEVLVLLQWFNPLIYAYRRSLRAVHEYIADDWVVRNTQRRYDYARVLVESARLLPPPDALPGAVNTFHSLIKNRLAMLAKNPSRPLNRVKYLLALPLCAAAMLLFSFRLVERLPIAAPLFEIEKKAETLATTLDQAVVFSEKPAENQWVKPKDTPYIFYWGDLMAHIFYDEKEGKYVADAQLSPAEFREAVWQKPFIWDATTNAMKPFVSFEVSGIYVDNTEKAAVELEKSRRQLADFAAFVGYGDRFQIWKLGLPNGHEAIVSIWISKPGGPDAIGPLVVDAGDSGKFAWGEEIWHTAQRRTFITLPEFWEMTKRSPVLQAGSGDGKNLNLRFFTISEADGTAMELNFYKFPSTEKELREHLDRLQSAEYLIKIGSKVSFAEAISEEDVKSEPARYAVFEIVAENDQRLENQLVKNPNFTFEWGKLTLSLGIFSGKTHRGADNLLHPADDTLVIFNPELTAREILDFLKTKPVLKSNGRPLHNLQFELSCQGQKASYDEAKGLSPASFLTFVEEQFRKNNVTVSLHSFTAERTDLRNLILEVFPADPAPARAAKPVELAAGELRVSPNPASGEVKFRFDLPEDSEVNLLIFSAEGRVLKTISAAGKKGENVLNLPTGEWKTSGILTATLESKAGSWQARFLVN